MPRNKKGTRSLATYLRRSDMKLPLATGVLLLVLLLGCTSPPKTGPERAVYVANEKGASLSVVDAATNKVVETIALGGHPHNVNVSADGKYFFATNHSEDEEEEAGKKEETEHDDHHAGGESFVRILDARTLQLVNSIALEQFGAHVVPSHDGRSLFASDQGADFLEVLDLEEGTRLSRIKTGHGPHGFVVSPNDQFVYTPNVASNDITVIDVAAQEAIGTIVPEYGGHACEKPVAMGIDTGGRYGVVTCGGSFDAYKIDFAEKKAVGRVEFRKGEYPGPIQTPLHPDGKTLYIPDMRNGVVHKVDFESFKLLKDIPVGKGAHGIAFSADGKTAYITLTWENALAVLDLATEQVRARIPVGEEPNGVAVRGGKNQGW